MPSFVLPYGTAAVVPGTVADGMIADPATAGAGGARAAVVALLRLTPAAGTGAPFNVVAPATGQARFVMLDPPLPAAAVSGLLALAPLPFPIATALAGLPGGVPTFYLAVEGGAFIPTDGDYVVRGDVIAHGATALHVGVLFQDRATVSPRTWLEAIGAVDSDWQTAAGPLLATLPRSLRILDHTGRPAASVPFAISAVPGTPGGIAAGPISATSTTGFLALPATGPIVLQQRTSAGLNDVGGGRIYSLYAPRNPGSVVASEPSAPASITLPASFAGGELQVLDVRRFLSPSYRTGCRLEPIVDGVATFQRLVDDLAAAAVAPAGGLLFGAALACHAPNFDFNLVQGDTTSRLSALGQSLLDSSAELRLLVNDLYRPRDPMLVHDLLAVAIVLVFVGLDVGVLLAKINSPSFAVSWFTVGLVALAFVGVAVATQLLTETTPEQWLEVGLPAFNAVNALTPTGVPRAVWSSYPARFTDNPLAVTTFQPAGQRQLIPLLADHLPGAPSISEIQDQFGAWHEKLHIVRRPLSAGGVEWTAYLGSIDLAPRWRDGPGHAGRPCEQPDDRVRDVRFVDPVHGVQARLTGPVLADLVALWNERWNATPAVRTPPPQAPSAPIWTTPPDATALDLGANGPGHVVALGRTFFEDPPPLTGPVPSPPRTADPTSDALIRPAGEKSLHDTLLRAITEARDYIYIEDAAFTPSESSDPAVSTIVSALVAAADTCRRLVVVVPAALDVRVGSDRRSALFARLSGAWGQRGVFASPIRRPFLPAAPAHTDQGRAVLVSALGPGPAATTPVTEHLTLWPYTRVPASFPAWLWVEGELMLATAGSRMASDKGDVAELTVQRGGPWGAKMRTHTAGAPATAAQLKGIVVGSSVVIVDDIFASIGSGSISRRGLFHDGELAAFAVPAGLRSARSNPARELRCALWAEHLGLPPAFGGAILADPLAAFDLFARRREQGNRLVPHASIDVFGLRIAIPTSLLGILSTIPSAFSALTDQTFFDFFQDPTGFGDPSVPPGT